MTNDELFKTLSPGDRIRRRSGKPWNGKDADGNKVVNSICGLVEARKKDASFMLDNDGVEVQWSCFCEWEADANDPVHGVEVISLNATALPAIPPAAALLIREGKLTEAAWNAAVVLTG